MIFDILVLHLITLGLNLTHYQIARHTIGNCKRFRNDSVARGSYTNIETCYIYHMLTSQRSAFVMAPSQEEAMQISKLATSIICWLANEYCQNGMNSIWILKIRLHNVSPMWYLNENDVLISLTVHDQWQFYKGDQPFAESGGDVECKARSHLVQMLTPIQGKKTRCRHICMSF